jgi:hypothetical protein
MIGIVLSRFQKLLSTTYDRLPICVRVFIAPMLEPAYFTIRRVLLVVSQIHTSIYRLQGKSRWSEGTLTTLLFGEGKGILPYVLNLLYAEEPTRQSLGKDFIWKMKSHVKSGTDLVVVGMDGVFARFLSRQGFLVMPEWVMLKLNPANPLPTGRRNKALHENLKKVRKYGYTFEMTRDPAKFEYFYHHMYLRYARKRHGKLSFVGRFDELRKIFERGGLLLVNRGNECIAGLGRLKCLSLLNLLKDYIL